MDHKKARYQIDKDKIVIFGAGKIGRSFIGQLFSRSGYKVVFVDIKTELIDHLNKKQQYKVVIKDNSGDEVLIIKNVKGIDLNNSAPVVSELADSGIAALSVGQQGLPDTLPVIAEALVLRRKLFGDIPLDFIIAENMRNSDQFLETELCKLLPGDYPLKKLAGLVETSIGKMVPIMSQKDLEDDPLQVFAEPYNTLIVAKKGFKNPVPQVQNIDPKENIKAWVDRKLFIHNLGHATAAYLGFRKHPQAVYIYEVLDDPEIFEGTRNTMLQSADILIALYPGEFTAAQLEAHIDDLLLRFRNKALGDTLFRVGCDLYRKLSPEDRMVAPIKAAVALNKPYDLILKALVSGVSFRAKDENGHFLPSDEAFFGEADKGVDYIIKDICRLNI
ncbi:MAG: NAD-binding protein [Bacteroidota bacterium]|nr:NAD-binding protein [Bacteroidota bacterium]